MGASAGATAVRGGHGDPAGAIAVAQFRQIMFLPLTLSADLDAPDLRGAVRCIADGLEAHGWSQSTDLLGHLATSDDTATLTPEAYAEFVYFHGFIQKFLYRKQVGNAAADLRLFQRNIGAALSVELPGFTVSLNIERLSLYLFDLGVAILVLEVSAGDDPCIIAANGRPHLTLAHAQALQNALRRLYPPYFEDDGTPEYPARIGISDKTYVSKNEDWRGQVARERTNPLAQFWRDLLSPLGVEGYHPAKHPGGVWRQIIDERLPSMCFIETEHGKRVRRGDFMRLCFADNPSNDRYPYAEEFLKDFEREHCYDRHWYGDYGTRYLFSGYAMVMIGTGAKPKTKPGERFFRDVLQPHFRRHYFQMGLLNQLQVAALLAISHDLSQSADVRETEGGPADRLRERAAALQRRFLAFQQHYWFTQISNQLQAREMYALWRERLGTQELHEEVKEQLENVNDFLDGRWQEKMQTSAERLNIVAVLGLVFGLTASILGMNVVVSEDFFGAAFKTNKALHVLLAFGALFAVSGVARRVLDFLVPVQPGETAPAGLGRERSNRGAQTAAQKLRAILHGILAVSAGAATLALIAFCNAR